MLNEIRDIQIEEAHITALDNVGPAKAKAIIALAGTLGALLDLSPQNLSDRVKGLSENTARSVLSWAQGEWDRLVATPVAGAPVDLELAVEEEVLDDEEPQDVVDPVVGPEFDGLAITERRHPRAKLKLIKPPGENVIEIRPLFDRKIVVRKDR